MGRRQRPPSNKHGHVAYPIDRLLPGGGGSKPVQSHFGVFGAPPIFRTYFGGDWDVHWGYDLDFDPWPCVFSVQTGSVHFGAPSMGDRPLILGRRNWVRAFRRGRAPQA